jgi:hypothetical protein
MSEFDPELNAHREKVYRHLMPRVITAFHIPLTPIDKVRVTEKEWADLLRTLPFPCIKIVTPTQRVDPGESLSKDMIIEIERSGNAVTVTWSNKVRVITDDFISDMYSIPGDHPRAQPVDIVCRLLTLLRDSRNRYIEKPVSRQVKRAQGIKAPDYHEYIIIDRRDIKPEDDARPWKDISRRMPYLHAVRAHLRRLECGRLVQVRAHTRGKGTLFQVKDYAVVGSVA